MEIVLTGWLLVIAVGVPLGSMGGGAGLVDVNDLRGLAAPAAAGETPLALPVPESDSMDVG